MLNNKYRRKLVDKIALYLYTDDVIVIYGARQVGKTSLLQYLMENYLKSNTFYMDLELRNLLELCNSGPEETHKYLLQKGADKAKKIFLLIDEIQYLENPTNFIKIIADHYKNIKLVVSGSSTFEIRKKFKESLAGRTVTFELYPLDFEEFLIFKNKKYSLTKENSKTINEELIPLAEEFIRFGGYPKIALEDSIERKTAYLYQIIDTYVKKDIRDIGNIRDIEAFNKLLEVLASQTGCLLNVSELSNTLKISRITIIEYLELLEKTFIIKKISPYHKNLRSELTKNQKIFFLDTGMAHLLWLKEFPKELLGNMFETAVFAELIKSGFKVNFWRTTAKQEVDFVISAPLKGIIAIESKINFSKAQINSTFAEEYKCKSFVVGLRGEKNGKYFWEMTKELENKPVD